MAKSFKDKISKNIAVTPTHEQVESGQTRSLYESTKQFRNARIIPLEQISLDPSQPRQTIDEETIQELSDSIKRHGMLQPVTVTALLDGLGYIILTGERRYRASRMAGLVEIPCVVISPNDSADKYAKQLVENLIREDLSPMDKAYGLLAYKEMLGSDAAWEQVERDLSISETRRKQLIRLLNLPEDIQSALIKNATKKSGQAFTEKHARALLLLKDRPRQQLDLFEELVQSKNTITADEAMRKAREARDHGTKKKRAFVIHYKTKNDLIEQLKAELKKLTMK